METVDDKWVASFACFSGSGDARLWLCCGGTDARYIRLNVAEDGALHVVSTEQYTADADTLSIDLSENPSTGYAWSWQATGALEEVDSRFEESGDGLLLGAAGRRVVCFKTTGQLGETELLLEYARSWEDSPVETRRLLLDISPGGQLNIIGISEK